LLSRKLPLQVESRCNNLLFVLLAEERREIELEIVSFPEGGVHTEHELTTNNTSPKQLTLLHTIPVSGYCSSVCSYQGNTYVGLGDGVDIIEGNNQSGRKFITATGRIHSVAVYKDRLYTLQNALKVGDPYTVTVHDLTGKLITSWTHSDAITFLLDFNKLTVNNDQAVLPDRLNKRLVVYSLTGEVQKHISCLLLSTNEVSVCAVDDICVVVSDCKSSRVFKMNILCGEVEWTSEHVTGPQGVTCKEGRVFVTNCSTHT